MKIRTSSMSMPTLIGLAVIVATPVFAADYLPFSLALQTDGQASTLPAPDGATGSVEGSADAAAQDLASQICAQTAALSADASAVDIEAAIVFALSQSTVADTVKQAALVVVPRLCPGGSGQATALASAASALAQGRLNGTAALANGNAGSTFTAPSIDVSGGSVNYTAG